MKRITGKQCKTARSLLKWNLHDLAARVKAILPRRIDSFEHGVVHLMEWEYAELLRVFVKAGIHFKPDMEVTLRREDAEPEKIQGGMTQEGARIVLDTDLTVVSDSSAERSILPDTARREEKRKEEDDDE